MSSYEIINPNVSNKNHILGFFYIGISIFGLLVIIKSGVLTNKIDQMKINNSTKINNNKISQLNKIKLKTAKGIISFNEILHNLYKPLGFDVDSLLNIIIPKLRQIEQKSCDQIYDDWLFATKINITTLNNPLELLHDKYTLNGYSTMSQCYFNDSYNNEQLNNNKIAEESKKWTQEIIDKLINEIKNENYSNLLLLTYVDSVSVYHATKYYNIIGMKGAVIGSINPWVESMCLANGANKIVTIDYQHIKIRHKDIIFLDVFDLVKRREVYFDSFDFIASFSSIEHSGLGRYGDPLDPMGDIREMQKLSCILKPGGLFFFGVPVGQDDVGNNCHRTYGRIRLPLMFAGFEILDVFYMQPLPIDMTAETLEDNHGGNPLDYRHYLFVLRKTK